MDGDRFVVVRQIGAGGMGVVYEAIDRTRNAPIALKTLRHLEPAALYRFKKEFRALADLSHPNLVHLHELVSAGDEWFFTMELVDGTGFLEHIGSDAPRLREGLRQLAQGVAALHRAGKLHRDLKPSNVLVTRQGRVVICDFGLVTSSAADDPYRSSEQHLVGTAAYMSPEHAAGRPLSEASDWYSVGVILYQALTGQLPFAGRSQDILRRKQVEEPAEPRTIHPDVPDDLNQLCVEMLRRVPERRPPGRTILARLGVGAPAAAEAPDAVFVGREGELAGLEQAFVTAASGRAVTVLVHGASGVGKTSLVRRFLHHHRQALVLSGRCFQRESVPYKALDDLIDALSAYLVRLPEREVLEIVPRDVQSLARLFPVLRRVPAVADPPLRRFETPDPLELRRRAFAALRELLDRLARSRPVVVHIDDLQWGDVDSAALLSSILRPPAPPPLLLLACYRSEDAPNPFLATLRAQELPDVREVVLGALPPPEARELASNLGATAHADEIARESHGNPFFVYELVRHARASEQAVRAPITLDEALRARIGRLPEAARTLLGVVAVAGRPVGRDVVSRAAGLGPDQHDAAELLCTENFLRARGPEAQGGWEAYHDRIREVVVESLPPPTLRALHLRLAAALRALDESNAEALVDHLVAGGETEQAAQAATVAAERAAHALAFDRAARLYRFALDHGTGTEADRRELRRRLADALANAGRGAEAAEAYLLAAEGASASDALELRRRSAEQLLRSGRLEAGLERIRDLLRMAGLQLALTPRRALFSLLLRRMRLRLRGLRFRERDPSQLAPAALTQVDICWSVASTLSMVDTVRGNDFQARHFLLALEAGEPYRVARGAAMEAGYSSIGGGRAIARTKRLLALTQSVAERTGHPHALALSALAAGCAAFLQGRWKEASERAEAAEAMFRERCTGVAWEMDTAQFFALGSLACRGELAELWRRVPVLLGEAEERGDLYAATGIRSWRTNIAWLGQDDPEEARRQVLAAQKQWSQRGFHLQHYYELLALTQIDLYVGDAAGAGARVAERWRALEGSLLLRVQNVRLEALALRARCALASGRDDPLVERCAARIDAEHMAWSDPLALALRAALALRRDPAAAAALLDAAAAGFDAADMGMHAAAARRQRALLRAEAPDDGWMIAHGVRNPARMSAMLLPGFTGC